MGTRVRVAAAQEDASWIDDTTLLMTRIFWMTFGAQGSEARATSMFEPRS